MVDTLFLFLKLKLWLLPSIAEIKCVHYFCKCNQNWVTSYVRNVFFPLFWCYKRKWNHSSVTPAVSAKQNWPQLSAGYKFRSQEKSAGPTVCTVSVEIVVSVEIGWDEAVKDVERFGSQKKTTFGWTWFRLKLHWQKQYSPSVIVSGLVCRHEAWDISFQLRFLFIVWQRFFCDWWNPCVSAMCHCKSAGVKYSRMIVRSRSWIDSFIYFFICLYTNSSTLLFNRGIMLLLDYFGC